MAFTKEDKFALRFKILNTSYELVNGLIGQHIFSLPLLYNMFPEHVQIEGENIIGCDSILAQEYDSAVRYIEERGYIKSQRSNDWLFPVWIELTSKGVDAIENPARFFPGVSGNNKITINQVNIQGDAIGNQFQLGTVSSKQKGNS